MKRLVILGAGGHGRVAADIAGKNGYDSIAFLDDTKKTCGRYPVMGESARFSEYDCDFFVAIGNPQVRRRMQEMLHGMWWWVVDQPGVVTLRYTVSPDNAASQAIIRKLGFAHVGQQIDEEDGPEDIFEMSAAEYRRRYLA